MSIDSSPQFAVDRPLQEFVRPIFRRSLLEEQSDAIARRLIYAAVALCVSLILVGGAFSQLQMFALGGFVPVTTAIFKAILVAALLAYFVVNGGEYRVSPAISFSILFLLEIVLQCVTALSHSGFLLRDVLASDFFLYFLPLLTVLSYAVNIKIPTRYLVALLGVLGAASLYIAIAQFATGTAILPVTSADGNFSVLSAYLYGRIRAFGLFATSMEMGVFSSFVGGYGVLLMTRDRRYFPGACVFAAGAIGAGVCLTRASQVCFVLTVLFAVLLSRALFDRWVRYLPALSILAAVLVAVYAGAHALSGNTMNITSTESFSLRLLEWRYFWDYYVHLPLLLQVVGAGLMQHVGGEERIHNLSNATSLFMDNNLLAILLNTGIVGVSLMVTIYLALWRKLWSGIRASADSFHLSALIMVASLLFSGFYAVTLPEISLFAIIAFATQE